MKLLIVTQAVDRRHPILGFFHSWIEAFAKACGSVTVIGQQVGDHALPENVNVRTLHKESSVGIFGQIFRFWQLCIVEDYDVVLVHMTPVWIVLGAPIWIIRGVPMYLWYEARGARWPLRVALFFVRAVFSASPHGMPLATPKSVVTGHGIDTDLFRPGPHARDMHRLVTVGRVTASKRLPILLDCLSALPGEYRLRVVGTPVTADDRRLLDELHAEIDRRGVRDRVEIGALPHADVIAELQSAAMFLHASETSLDKALLEAMACGCIAVSCASAAADVLPDALRATPETMPAVVARACALPEAERDALRARSREMIERHHGLKRLIDLLVARMQPATL